MFTIISIGNQPTVHLAAQELLVYLEKATGQTGQLEKRERYEANLPALWVGLADQFSTLYLPVVEDAVVDDAIAIQTQGASGILTGNNPRSVLLAAYRYLHELGCRWVRPTVDGEYVPQVDLGHTAVSVNETPSYRHRGICIEGSVSKEHVLEIVRWLPKVGMNSYFIQFREGFTFFDRFYTGKGQTFTVADARAIVKEIVAEAKARDLLVHAVGHGWTCEPFGMVGLGWDYPPEPVPPESIQFLAQVNGKRELWGGVPLNTNLCYSNPEVRRRMIEAIADYAQEHADIDLIHFWLADGMNNHCECERCQGTSPSDFYVMMLNELDRVLTDRQLKTRIVFLIYFDLLWPPVRERLTHPDRFILMFAPITRTYSQAFGTDSALPALPPFVLNQLSFPRSVEQNVAFLRAWQAQFAQSFAEPIDSFDFDYHLMWDHVNDPGYTQTARILHRDLQLLSDLDLNGFNSCQVQRASFPTGLPMTIMGWTLWNRAREFDAMADDYFAHAYGSAGRQVRDYLERLTDLFDPPYLRGEKPNETTQAAEKLGQVPALIAQFKPVIEKQLASVTNPCWRESWSLLQVHAELVSLLAAALESRTLGELEKARKQWSAMKGFIQAHQAELDGTFDDWLFIHVYERRFADAPQKP